jgi:hypothetical protein
MKMPTIIEVRKRLVAAAEAAAEAARKRLVAAAEVAAVAAIMALPGAPNGLRKQALLMRLAKARGWQSDDR